MKTPLSALLTASLFFLKKKQQKNCENPFLHVICLFFQQRLINKREYMSHY